MLTWKESARYEQVSEVEDGEQSPKSEVQRRPQVVLYVIALLATLLIGIATGVLLSRTVFNDQAGEFGKVQTIWSLNETFAGRPSVETEKAWQSLVPLGRGFITHPVLAPEGKSLSVFHQLHCLHALQMAYYKQLHKIELLEQTAAADSYIGSLHPNTELDHIQHCFDYVRQALICAADTNLEPKNKTTGKTNGWGFERTCRNYQQVLDWAEHWRNNGETTILSGDKQLHTST